MFGVVFPTRFQDSEILKILELTTDSIDLFVYIKTELSYKKVLFWIKCMLQEEFFEEFLTTI